MDIDIQGGEKIHNNDIECSYLFIDAPSVETLEERLRKRGTETPEVIEKRVNNARKEIERGQELTFYNHIVNDDLNSCFQNVAKFIDDHYHITIHK